MTEEKRPSVMIATPMYGGMCTGAYTYDGDILKSGGNLK